ncbi:MAG: HIT family protein [Candidatus Woesearchaeota archaeon]|nr:MAG: HIT family protein [Candidatus Woesearchaeota archaeon]
MSDCLFCLLANKKIPAIRVKESDDFIAFLDIEPISPGHTVVIAKQHTNDLLDFSDVRILSFMKEVAQELMRKLGATGCNLGLNHGRSAGQVVMHTHFHLIPRYENDGLVSWPGQKDADLSVVEAKLSRKT